MLTATDLIDSSSPLSVSPQSQLTSASTSSSSTTTTTSTSPTCSSLDRISDEESLISRTLSGERLSVADTSSFTRKRWLFHEKVYSKNTNSAAAQTEDSPLVLFVAIVAWYSIGVGAIVTTKILLTDWNVPPMLLTFQQLVAGSTVLRIVLSLTGRTQPLPWQGTAGDSSQTQHKLLHVDTATITDDNPLSSLSPLAKLIFIWENHSDYVLTGLFNALDFLASNTAFSGSAASFVETIKSSDPITTTAVALAWNVDRLAGAESVGLFLLVAGVLLSTWGNAESSSSVDSSTTTATDSSLVESIQSTATVLMANMCFAFRAMFQKRYRKLARADESQEQLNDINLLCRMQQTGAVALLIPTLLVHALTVLRAMTMIPRNVQLYYVGLSGVNALCYSTYNLASTYVLSKLTVLQHSSLGCLRRMCAIVATSIFFGVPITFIGAMGLLTSFIGFFSFTYCRNQRQQSEKMV